jgi:flavin-dependent dehydrogenase
MREAGSDIEQTGAVVTVVERQIDELLKGMAKKETAGVLPKPRAKRERKEKKGKRRVVVTGIGAVTPLGLTVDEYWRGCSKAGQALAKPPCAMSAV